MPEGCIAHQTAQRQAARRAGRRRAALSGTVLAHYERSPVALRAVVHHGRPPYAGRLSLAARSTSDEHDWAQGPRPIEEDNLLQARTVSTGVRLAREVVQRLAVLTDDEVELLVDATSVRARPPDVGRRLPPLRPHRRVRRGSPARAVPAARPDAATTRTSTASSGARRSGTTSWPTLKDSTLQQAALECLSDAAARPGCCQRAGTSSQPCCPTRVAAVLARTHAERRSLLPDERAAGQGSAMTRAI